MLGGPAAPRGLPVHTFQVLVKTETTLLKGDCNILALKIRGCFPVSGPQSVELHYPGAKAEPCADTVVWAARARPRVSSDVGGSRGQCGVAVLYVRRWEVSRP